MTGFRAIAALYKQHRNATFPQLARAAEFRGTDLVLLDSNIAGCVLTYLENKGDLAPHLLEVLNWDRIVARQVALEHSDAETRSYFDRLATLAERVCS